MASKGAAAFLLCSAPSWIQIAALDGRCIVGAAMERILLAAALAAIPFWEGGATASVLHDPVALNIGVNCHWQTRCMSQQRAAMKRALNFVARSRPPQWRLQLCNRNASRGGNRVDWIGFDHCIRNAALKEPANFRKHRR